MRTVLRPAAESRDRGEAWRETISRTFGGLDVRLDHGVHEWDRIVIGSAGPLRILESHTGPGESSRDRFADGEERFALYVQGEGVTVAEQRGRSDRYRDGDLGLVDLSQPFRCRYTRRRLVMATFPKALSPLPGNEVDRILGTRIAGRVGTAALLAGLVRQLPAQLDGQDGAAGGPIATAVLDLLHAGLARRFERESVLDPASRRRDLVLRCRAFIEEHLANPHLNPAAVAAAHHISLRYLHRIFEGSDDGVAGLIRRRRLERCRRDLLDPALSATPAGAVGARWGFTEPANFNRAFKRQFGLPPGSFRAEFG